MKMVKNSIFQGGKLILGAKQNFDYSELIKALISLSKPINIFFDKVQINDKNLHLKINRLCLLFKIKNYVVREIDFSKIIKGKEL